MKDDIRLHPEQEKLLYVHTAGQKIGSCQAQIEDLARQIYFDISFLPRHHLLYNKQKQKETMHNCKRLIAEMEEVLTNLKNAVDEFDRENGG